ncbi:MAG: hypothetical protein GXP09_04740 [Gammaproteobacteria bacterium]|nr:hypothetical protein [Gammaproteobacteria bacterium]
MKRRYRRFLPLSELASRWAVEVGQTNFDAAGHVAKILGRYRHCLTVECDKLSEIKHGIADEVMASRREKYINEINAIIGEGNGFDRLCRYAIKVDGFSAALQAESVPTPSFLPQPEQQTGEEEQSSQSFEQAS